MHYIMYLLLLHDILQLVMYKNNTCKKCGREGTGIEKANCR